MNQGFYTGVGNVNAPENAKLVMRQIGLACAHTDLTLRSDGAFSSSLEFETGCDLVNGTKEIYIPWASFNKVRNGISGSSPEALEILKKALDPSHFNLLDRAGRMVHARNVHTVLGKDLQTPSKFLICWSSGSLPVGNVASPIRVAQLYSIPVINLGDTTLRQALDRIESLL